MAYVLEREDLELEDYCYDCSDGTSYRTGQKCEPCQGTGYVMTDFGKKVLEFVQKRMTQ